MVRVGSETVSDTTAGFAARWGVGYSEASGLLGFLKAKGLVEVLKPVVVAGEKRPKGRPTLTYVAPVTVEVDCRGGTLAEAA